MRKGIHPFVILSIFFSENLPIVDDNRGFLCFGGQLVLPKIVKDASFDILTNNC